MINITEFTSILVLVCEWYLTGKETERCCLCDQHMCGTCIYQKSYSGFTVIYWDSNVKGTTVSSTGVVYCRLPSCSFWPIHLHFYFPLDLSPKSVFTVTKFPLVLGLNQLVFLSVSIVHESGQTHIGDQQRQIILLTRLCSWKELAL